MMLCMMLCMMKEIPLIMKNEGNFFLLFQTFRS